MKTNIKLNLTVLMALVIMSMSACAPAATTSITPAALTTQTVTATATLPNTDTQVASLNQTVPVTDRSAALAASGDSLQADLIAVYKQTNPAVVYIIIPDVGSGSGFVYSADGYIVTNNHVVEAGSSYEVVFATGKQESAKLIGHDADSDLAVLKVDQLPSDVKPLTLAPDDSLQVGQFVIAIGNPFGEQGSMSFGIVSGLDRSLQSQRATSGSSHSLPEVIQTDAPINPGNSGGPLLNLDGEVVGINSAIATTTGTSSGVGFAIPVSAIRRVVPELIKNGKYVYSYMGATFDDEVSLDEQTTYGLSQTQGAYVISVTPNSPAAKAGLIGANTRTGRGGDLIIAMDGQSISNFEDLNGYLVFHTSVGQTIQLTVLRNEQKLTIPLTLGARP
jgi:2-alkenal reductase